MGSLPIVTIIVAVCFALMGVGAFARPRNFTAVFGITAETPDARNEIQAVYGGFGLTTAAALLAPIWHPALLPGVTAAVALALAGMAGGRVIAAIRERPGRWPLVFFVIEAAGAAALANTLRGAL